MRQIINLTTPVPSQVKHDTKRANRVVPSNGTTTSVTGNNRRAEIRCRFVVEYISVVPGFNFWRRYRYE